MTPGDLLVALTLGLVGSLHCVQMCGPIVLACSVALEKRPLSQRWLAQGSYNLGRILTYSLLGAVAGTAGTGLNLLGHLAGMKNSAAIAAGMLLLLGGGLLLSGVRLGRAWSVPSAVGRLVGSGKVASRFVFGLALGLLPCGLVYAALLKALESAGTLAGALTMAVFGVGTAVPLLALGAFSSVLGPKVGRHAVLVSGIAVVFTGALLVWRGLQSPPSCCH